MPARKRYARIAITLPREVLAAADRLAARLDRSRSWVIAEAVRQFEHPTAVRDVASSPYSVPVEPGLGGFRLAQLQADLRLSPEERVKAAEATARLDRLMRPARGDQLVFFDDLDQYVRWKQREALGG